MVFSAFNLSPSVVSGIPKEYSTPTPIQNQAIPKIMEGGDVLGIAQTGTGKTAAFVLPILNRLVQGEKGKVRALILAPTRELAEQINSAIKVFGAKTGLTSTTVYGGVSMVPQIEKLRRGVDIIVACPGRLLDHMTRKTVNLSALQVLVLDEADQMFDMGFLPTIRRILKVLPTKKQSLLFSATMPSEIKNLAMEILYKPATVQVDMAAPAKTVSHSLYPVDQSKKTGLLLHILRETDSESVLVFTRTKHRAKRLGADLEGAGYKATSFQGNLSQGRRQAALNGFKSGRYQILVATDIAARGIDISTVSHVINYDIPESVDAYTHRIGRTGRAERTGDAFTFVTHEDESMVRSIERVLGSKIERRHNKEFAPDPSAPRVRSDDRPRRNHRSGGGNGGNRGQGGRPSNNRGFGAPRNNNRGSRPQESRIAQ